MFSWHGGGGVGGGGGQQTKRLSKRSNLSANFAANRVDMMRRELSIMIPSKGVCLTNKFHFSAIKIDPEFEIDCSLQFQ